MAPRVKDEQPPQRRNWVSPLAPNALAAGHAALARAGFEDPAIVLHWEKIAGPETARLARPLRLSKGDNGGVLTLLAEPAAALFLQHDSRTLCERINAYFGRPLVVRLRFIQASLAQPEPPPKPAKPAAEPAPDDPVRSYGGPDGLREALWKLARARHNRG